MMLTKTEAPMRNSNENLSNMVDLGKRSAAIVAEAGFAEARAKLTTTIPKFGRAWSEMSEVEQKRIIRQVYRLVRTHAASGKPRAVRD
jgi:hypothetical protein